MASASAGLFTWHELTTKDPVVASAFYGALLGWTVEEVPMGPMGVYRIFRLGDRQTGGCMESPPGGPTAWISYVWADDVDGTCAAVKERGGQVMVPPTTVPDMVRFAIAVDPQGAVFAVFQGLGAGADQAPPPPVPGTFCWDELQAVDQEGAKAFYGAIFGWTGKAGVGSMPYWHWRKGEKDVGGMMAKQSPHGPPHWLAYIGVEDVAASTAKARTLGATIHVDTLKIPEVGDMTVLQDPTGAVVALFRSARG